LVFFLPQNSILTKLRDLISEMINLVQKTVILASVILSTAAGSVCENFAVHGGSAITFAGSTITGGDVGVSPGTAITGIKTIVDGEVASTADSAQFIASAIHAHDEAMGIQDGATPIVSPEIGELTFTPGTYRSGTISIVAAKTVTLDGQGDPNSKFLFQAVTTMLVGAGCKIVLTNGAKAENVLWAAGTTFTAGAGIRFEGSIMAGTAITFGADTVLGGSILALTAITFGAENKVNGCVVALTAITFGAGNSVTYVRAPTAAPTKSPTPEPTAAPTKSPTPAPTASSTAATSTAAPTKSPTPAPTASSTAVTSSAGDVARPPACDSDVFEARQIGVTKYLDKPLTILSQTSNKVTFELSQKWFLADTLDHLFIRFKDTDFGYPTCLAFENTNPTWKSDSLTAICTKNSKLALVEVWASDDAFSGSDNATLPSCACGDHANLPPMVKYMFTVECVSTCSADSCSVTPSVVTTDSDSSPDCVDDSLNDVCGSVAIHAHDTITFASGEKTRVVGDIGVSPGTSITGEYLLKPGGQVQNQGDSQEFASSMWGTSGSYASAIAERTNENYMGEAIEIGGKTFYPGTYRTDTAINFAYGTTVTLDGKGDPNAVFLFQAGTTLVTAADSYFILKNGANAKNIIWALGTAATLGARSILEGSILAGTAITFGTMSELRGCAIAQSAVTFESRGYVNVRQQNACSGLDAGEGACENFAVHARTTITFAGAEDSVITNGDIGVSPGTSITGNHDIVGGTTVLGSSEFATSAMFNHADLRSRRSDETYWGVGMHEIGGETFYPGTYRAGTAINFVHGTTVTLDGKGDPNSVFLFQAGSTLVTAADTYFILKNGANAKNIIWALGTAATLGARSVVEGSIFAGTAITFGTESELHGCAIAMTAVTFETEGIVDVP
jgi:hypothetical protein